MKLPALAIRRPVAVLMVVCIVLVLGGFSFANLPVDLLPDMSFPIVAVYTTYEGAAPAEVENMVTRPLEQVLATVPSLESITSTSGQGTSLILLSFSWGTNLDFRLLDVREKIDLVRGMLPDDAGTPMVIQADPSMMPIMSMAVMGDESAEELKRIADDVIKPRLERIEGVASVEVVGGLEREIQVIVDPVKLSSYGLTLDQLGQVLRMENLNVSAGKLSENGSELQVRTVGQYRSLSDLENVVLFATPAGMVQLRDVATVVDTFKDQGTIMRLNGKPGVGLSVNKQSDANTVKVSNAVLRELARMESSLPAKVGTQVIFDQADFIRDAIENVINNGLVGALLAVVVLFLFLRSLGSTLVIGLAIPVSVISTFVLMYFNGLTLNIISLGGLALGVGMMVDNAIVILENIFRLKQGGMDTTTAAVEGSVEVADAILASTLTTVVVFLPVVYVKGFASQIFSSMALTVSFSLLASLAGALTVVPVLSSRLLKADNKPEKGLAALFGGLFDRIDRLYGKLLRWALRRRALVILLTVAAFAGSLFLVPMVGTEFIPSMDDDWLSVSIRLPEGSPLEDTLAFSERMERLILDMEEVEFVYSTVGSGGGLGLSTSGSGNRAAMNVQLVPKDQRTATNQEVADKIRAVTKTMAGAEVSVTASQLMGLTLISGAPVSILIKGDSLDTLKELSEQVKNLLERVPGTREVTTSFDRGWPELQVTVDRQRAALFGVQSLAVASTLRTALSGQVVSRFQTGAGEVDVRLRLPGEFSQNVAALEQLELAGASGMKVPLGEVANFRAVTGPVAINRDDQSRSATVSAKLSGRSLGQVTADIMQELEMELPPGYSVQFGGEQEMMEDAFSSLVPALVLAILLVYMIMAAQFESLLHPFIIMFAMPQTFIGVVLSLALTGRTLNVPAFIGVIMLAGIVVNNAIVLVDYINKLRSRGYSMEEAVATAGPVRLRPILMTTLTTVLGMLPMALGIGSGAEIQAPLATVVIGGLTMSTLLTLVVVPVVYCILEGLKDRIISKRQPAAAGEGV